MESWGIISYARLFHQHRHAHERPDEVAEDRQKDHENDARDTAVDEKLPGGELLALIGDGVGRRADKKVKRHARCGQRCKEDDVGRHMQILRDDE